jgi:hypothetical protein
VLLQVLTDLTQPLAQLSDETPLALLLEVDSGLPEKRLRAVWQQAWRQSGIRQTTVPVEGSGLAVLDQWLDQRIGDQALLLVVALRFASIQPEGTAEAAVGLLFGNRLTQTTLPSMAYVHRPEQEREPTCEALLYAARQALDWVPLEAETVEHVWRVAIDTPRDATLAKVLVDVPFSDSVNKKIHDLDNLLGHSGKASPWLAIAAAAQTIQCGAGPQFISSGGSPVDTGLWSTVLTPVPPLSK